MTFLTYYFKKDLNSIDASGNNNPFKREVSLHGEE